MLETVDRKDFLGTADAVDYMLLSLEHLHLKTKRSVLENPFTPMAEYKVTISKKGLLARCFG
jgi:hypothetical protein